MSIHGKRVTYVIVVKQGCRNGSYPTEDEIHGKNEVIPGSLDMQALKIGQIPGLSKASLDVVYFTN